MTRRPAPDRRAGDERGVAMVIAVTIAAIGMVLVTSMLATGVHLQMATIGSKKWNMALHVAEGGVEDAVARLTADETYAGTNGQLVQMPGGEVEVDVTTPRPGWRVVTATGWVPAKDSPRPVNRRVQVTFGPDAAFNRAVYSETSVEVAAHSVIEGDVESNESIMLTETEVVGSVKSRTGSVQLGRGTRVRVGATSDSGSVFSGGVTDQLWSVRLESGAKVERDVEVQVERCDQTIIQGSQAYNVLNDGEIDGWARAAGTLIGRAAEQGVDSHACELRENREPLPPFELDPTRLGEIEEWDSVEAFNENSGSVVTGTHYIEATTLEKTTLNDVVDFSDKRATGDATIITTGRFAYEDGTQPIHTGTADDTLALVVLNDAGTAVAPAVALGHTLGLQIGGPAVLVYAEGLVEVRETIRMSGAIYAGRVRITNQSEIRHDRRIERVAGFGHNRYERVSFQELRPAPRPPRPAGAGGPAQGGS